MKKLFTTMLTVLASGAAFALPVGNPSEASLLCDGICWEGHCGDMCDPCLTWCDAFSFRVGFYGDYVFQRHLQAIANNGCEDYFDNSTITTNAAYLVANFWDRVDIFGTIGASSWSVDGNSSSFATDANTIPGGGGANVVPIGLLTTVDSTTDFSWSVGLRGTIWECGCTSIGAEVQYFQFHSDIMRVATDSSGNANYGLVYPFNDTVNSKYSEWQVGLGASHRINCFVPYVAVKWSYAQLTLDKALVPLNNVQYELPNAHLANRWGYAVGVSVVDCEKAAITGEARFGDETAASITGQFRF